MALAIVQTANGTQAAGTGVPSNVVLGSAPTVGNLVVAFLHTDTTTVGVTLNTTGWTQIANAITNQTFKTNAYALYRYVVGGDTVTLPAMATAGTCHWAYVAYEISGVTGAINKDLQVVSSYSYDSNILPAAGVIQQVPQTAGTLALLSGSNFGDNAANAVATGWTADVNTGAATNWGTLTGLHFAGPTAGTTIGAVAAHMGAAVQLILQTTSPASAYLRSARSDMRTLTAWTQQQTLQGAPTPGNLVVATIEMFGQGIIAVNATGWTAFVNETGGGNTDEVGLWRYAQNGDTATLPAFFTTGGTGQFFFQTYEIAGVNGAWLNDFQSEKHGGSTGTSYTTTTDTTLQANTLALIGAGANYTGNNTAPTVSSPWAIGNLLGQGPSFNASQTFASKTSSVAATVTEPSSVSVGYIQFLIGAAPAGSGGHGLLTVGVGK